MPEPKEISLSEIERGARVLHVGFDLGFYDRAQLDAWVTHAIEALEAIPDPLLELATLAHRSDQEIVDLLAELAAPGSWEERARIEIGMLAEMEAKGRLELGAAIGRSLFASTDAAFELRGELYGIEDAYELARAGAYGSVEEARREYRAFASRYRPLASWDPSASVAPPHAP